MQKPELSHYPVWLREELFPDNPLQGRYTRQYSLDYERALRQVFNNRRSDPICLILSEMVLRSIRQEFRDYDQHEARVRVFQEHLERLSVLEKQIAALKKQQRKKKVVKK